MLLRYLFLHCVIYISYIVIVESELCLYLISCDCKYSIQIYVYSRTTCGQEETYLFIFHHLLRIHVA